MKYTLVRLKSTKEPVMVASEIKSAIELFWEVDRVVDPSFCEYKDVSIKGRYSRPTLFYDNAKGEDEDHFGFIASPRLCEEFAISLQDFFEDDSAWIEIPDGYTGIDALDAENSAEQDMF